MIKRRALVVGILFVALATVACGNDGSRGAAVVTLDAFSGLPNPTWDLTEAESDELVAMWAALDATAAITYPSKAGYRAMNVSFDDASQIWVARGVVVDVGTDSARADTTHALELWILETGRGEVEDTLLDTIRAEIIG